MAAWMPAAGDLKADTNRLAGKSLRPCADLSNPIFPTMRGGPAAEGAPPAVLDGTVQNFGLLQYSGHQGKAWASSQSSISFCSNRLRRCPASAPPFFPTLTCRQGDLNQAGLLRLSDKSMPFSVDRTGQRRV